MQQITAVFQLVHDCINEIIQHVFEKRKRFLMSSIGISMNYFEDFMFSCKIAVVVLQCRSVLFLVFLAFISKTKSISKGNFLELQRKTKFIVFHACFNGIRVQKRTFFILGQTLHFWGY